MKILQIHWRYNRYGGGESYLHSICHAQEEVGHTVAIISGNTYKASTELISGIEGYLIDASMGVRSGKREVRKVLEILERVKPDVVHLHQTKGLLSPLIVRAICLKLPSVKTVHDIGLVCPNAGDELIKVCKDKICRFPMGIRCAVRGCYPVFKKGARRLLISIWEKEVTKKLDRIIVSSNYMREELLRNGFQDKKLEVLPLYTEVDRGKPSFTASEESDKILLFVGRLDSVKGVIQFIHALHMLQGKEWKADILGGGPFFNNAQDMVKQMKLNGRVKFHGMVSSDKIWEFYRRSYLICMPSMIPESFGLVGIEAMAFGKPVVAFDSGGIREWLVDGETGFLVERGNVKRLAERISQLLEDESLAKKMGERGKERVERYYRRDMHLKRLLAIYEEVIDNRAKARIYK